VKSKKTEFDAADITAIVLADGLDFGRCPAATEIPPALWPVEGQSAFERVIGSLCEANLGKIVVCSNGHTGAYRQLVRPMQNSTRVVFMEEKLPMGSAGCLREGAKKSPSEFYLIVQANMASLPDPARLVKMHINSGSEFSVFTCTDGNGRCYTAGIYACNKSVLPLIPAQGFSDIKEGLIASLLRYGKKTGMIDTGSIQGCFRNREEYIRAVSERLKSNGRVKLGQGETSSMKTGAKLAVGDD
jgi:NDP-sugar pyrophosphorylase family protein